jgi:hypothetical protein
MLDGRGASNTGSARKIREITNRVDRTEVFRKGAPNIHMFCPLETFVFLEINDEQCTELNTQIIHNTVTVNIHCCKSKTVFHVWMEMARHKVLIS